MFGTLEALPHGEDGSARLGPREAHLVHEGLHVEDASPGRLELVLGRERIGQARGIEAVPLVADDHQEVALLPLEAYENALVGVLAVAMLDRVRHRFAKRDADPVAVLTRHAAM